MTDPRAEFGTGWQQWNHQAFLDWLIITFVMSRLEDVIPKTYLPILRLVSEDAAAVDEAYRAVLALREPVWTFLPDRPAAGEGAPGPTPSPGPALERTRAVVNGHLPEHSCTVRVGGEI